MRRCLFLCLVLFSSVSVLAGCGDTTSPAPSTEGVQQAVAQAYDTERVNVLLRQGNAAPHLEVVLVNPGGREATNRQAAYRIAQTAQAHYAGRSADQVRVSFEYSSGAGEADVGFHRRYTFTRQELQGEPPDTTSSPADTTAAWPDSARSRPEP